MFILNGSGWPVHVDTGFHILKRLKKFFFNLWSVSTIQENIYSFSAFEEGLIQCYLSVLIDELNFENEVVFS